MTQGLADIASPIHETRPVVRVLTALILSVITAVATSPWVPLTGLGLGVSFVLASRIPFKIALKRLLPLTGFLFVIWLVLPFTGDGEILKSLGPLAIHQGGVDLALLISMKSYAIVLSLMALVSTMHPFVLGHALGTLGMPRKLIFLMVMSSRYIHVLGEEFKTLRDAAFIRGFVPDTSLHTYRTYAHLAGMLLVRSHLRAGRVYKAMLLRGFDGEFRRISSPAEKSTGQCVPQMVCMGVACVGLVGVDLWLRWAF